ncbi:MAG: hypothetical protein SNJ68_14320 [Cyanobacteriota bacterium]
MSEHPTQRVTQPLAADQPALLEKRWPETEAASVQEALDVAALLLRLDRVADLDAAVAAGGDTALAAQWSVRGAWLAAGDTFGRANHDMSTARHYMRFFGLAKSFPILPPLQPFNAPQSRVA